MLLDWDFFSFQVLVVFYFAFHAFLNWRHGARGIEIIPHREFFMSCPGKCVNGWAVSLFFIITYNKLERKSLQILIFISACVAMVSF